MATMRYTQSAREMIPRMKFSIRVWVRAFRSRARRAQRPQKTRPPCRDRSRPAYFYKFTQRRRDERDNAAIVLLGVNLRPRTSRIRGSPFQLPTRLAVGLGLESGLETGCPASCAPSSTLRILGLPHPAPGRKPDFGCNGNKLITTAGSCQNKYGAPRKTPHKCCPNCRKNFANRRLRLNCRRT